MRTSDRVHPWELEGSTSRGGRQEEEEEELGGGGARSRSRSSRCRKRSQINHDILWYII
jgi:hypothetical protein